MQSFKSPLRKTWVRLAMLSLALSGAACDKAEKGTGRRAQLRCKTDGVCWQAIGKRSLEGAYRKGDKEFKFDAVFSPSRSMQTNFKDEWSYRVMDHQGVTFFTAASSNPPHGWSEADKGQEKLPADPYEQMDYLKERNLFATEMAQAVVQAAGPDGKLRDPWKQLCRHFHQSFLPDDSAKADLPRTEEAALAHDEMTTATASAGRPLTKRAADQAEEGWSGEALLDDSHPHTDLAQGVSVDEDEPDVLVTATHDVSHALSAPHSLYGFGGQFRKRTHPAEFKRQPGFEFQQDLDLYWRHTRSFLVGGWKTGKHHTAACITVKKRPLHSGGAWQMHDKECTENHGSKAGEGDMKLYARCNDMPVTKEFYVWKGECGGNYPSHLCNDDTALQIRHAYGLYDDGEKCLKRKRTHRPWCEQPW